MSEGIAYADIVILALIAGFILLRLRNVLGQRSEGTDEFPKPQQRPRDTQDDLGVLKLAERLHKPKPPEENDPFLATVKSPSVSVVLQQIKAKDPQFSATSFIGGAKMAYEMVFDAFAKGDKATLDMLLSAELQKHFIGEIEAREAQPEQSETTLLSVAANAISAAEFERNIARLTVDFTSEQVTLTRDGDGKITAGDASSSHRVEDSWVFERDITSKNPNWKIIET